MNIFTAPIGNITYEDIERFCDKQIEEGVNIEYKGQFPHNKNIAKKISSFANTHGGILILGVEEADRKPITPISGLDYEEGYEEKITSICLRNINPPAIPQLRICRDNDHPNKCVIIIRIEESDETPHRVDNDTSIYVRVNSQSEPIKAPFKQIEWLLNRRNKANINRERLLTRAESRFKSTLQASKTRAFRTFSIIPHFPYKVLFGFSDFHKIIEATKLNLSNQSFPYNYRHPISQNESQVFIFDKKTPRNSGILYAEINQFGLIWNRETFWDEFSEDPKNTIELQEVMDQLIMVLTFAQQFYKYLGFWGGLELVHSMEGIKKRYLGIVHRGGYSPEYNKGCSIFDDSFLKNETVNVASLIDSFDKISINFFKNFLWSCGTPDLIDNEQMILGCLEASKSKILD